MNSGPATSAFTGGWQVVPRHRVVDQVVRLRRFSASHPEVSIELRRETWTWEATYPASGDGTRTVCAPELGEVLDRLERILPETPGRTPDDGQR